MSKEMSYPPEQLRDELRGFKETLVATLGNFGLTLYVRRAHGTEACEDAAVRVGDMHALPHRLIIGEERRVPDGPVESVSSLSGLSVNLHLPGDGCEGEDLARVNTRGGEASFIGGTISLRTIDGEDALRRSMPGGEVVHSYSQSSELTEYASQLPGTDLGRRSESLRQVTEVQYMMSPDGDLAVCARGLNAVLYNGLVTMQYKGTLDLSKINPDYLSS